MKWKKYNIPIYEIDTFFCIEEDSGLVEKKIYSLGYRLRENDYRELHEDNTGISIPLLKGNENKAYLLRLQKFKRTPGYFNTLVHEISHIKSFIWEHIGVQNGVPVQYDEFEAYLMGHVMEVFMQFASK